MTEKQTKQQIFQYASKIHEDHRKFNAKQTKDAFKQLLINLDKQSYERNMRLKFQAAPHMLKIAQATLGEQVQGLAGDPTRRGAKPWWQSGWKSEGEAVEALRSNPELIQHFDNQPGFPKDLFKQ